MSYEEIIEQLERGEVADVIKALKAAERAYEQWLERQEQAAEPWAVARELSSNPEQVEEIPW